MFVVCYIIIKIDGFMYQLRAIFRSLLNLTFSDSAIAQTVLNSRIYCFMFFIINILKSYFSGDDFGGITRKTFSGEKI